MIVKVCGMRDEANIRAVEALGVDLMGFILYPKSPRYVERVPDYMPVNCRRVGVFVNEAEDVVLRKVEEFGLDYVQLHGSESPEYCVKLRDGGIKVIKAISVAEASDVALSELYDGVCDMLLFDTKCKEYGGSGQQFNWSILNQYIGKTNFLLSGGIGVESISSLKGFNHPQLVGYDVNSRFECAPALKYVEQIDKFVKELK